ncbi:hypothetical protein B0P06_005236 [Clostridium saccharoperbutylacetonicum]|uniref:Uncharacterized protein n=2 Tax=Clostridium saccharoperbutylacetonicum TaxID=36745 RepID=M1LTW9_9CLOT|nr:hypothetical protein [Clostridium saccharoperbutylacetonicum]AGF56495.1 hypothetical protein Cspa_c27300 [Clostridium saccharoperbutylacetonicum N1-4(HMT)]NRT62758.1 hypothetical protein [Clostridium saccharoperbutylacetonicum]NSB26110.1 hypothetical protein [Clostridium saccharoperbutylacetonicum]NSB45465.1 hypothetical protein [Clostridium saccharoperbutylacetonicum]
MKQYMKNKNFIPEKVYKEIQLSQSKREIGILVMFLIINLLMLPTTASRISVNRENEEQVLKVDNKRKNPVYFKDINIWLNNIFDDRIEEIHVTNGKGEIVVKNFDKINELSINPLIKIVDINSVSEDKYKLGVHLNE